METAAELELVTDTLTIASAHLKREVALNLYLPKNVVNPATISLLLINDGQDMAVMEYDKILHDLYLQDAIHPILSVAITAGSERTQEYGVAKKKDYLGRGSKAGAYSKFIINELLPFISETYQVTQFKEIAFAGFSLGGLSALDMVWNNPEVFSRAGVFSGSLWWRSVDQHDGKYDDNKHRIMQQQIRKGAYAPGLKFFFECGKLDESGDRNNNGIIDSIDDTLDHIKELFAKGYGPEDIAYLELDEGKHDVPTWGLAMPAFLKWGWGK
ncbi:alpha/beta hydrolase [Niabella hibiscisoli]|uniref:alpha/beta hydrolase n=1 Tax=Niabella hibiscisoli TaxID=1825928 RepID=UPI001F113307|nr:alpha/beta hydrolase-fold protein [Niabella hibiscisoli]MCH5714992.1 esterase family protein [Niabella hibiscisoli]